MWLSDDCAVVNNILIILKGEIAMINTNSIVFKVVSCVASALVAVGATTLVTNKIYRDGFFTFKTPAITFKDAKAVVSKAIKDKTAELEAAKKELKEAKDAVTAAGDKVTAEQKEKADKANKNVEALNKELADLIK